MATFNLKHFSDPGALKRISLKRLLAFLEPHREYLSKRGMEFPAQSDSDGFDYERLVTVFMNPDKNMPQELFDGLYFVDEMSTEESADILLEELSANGKGIEETDPTPADVALHAWLVDRNAVQRKHTEQFLVRDRRFEYFQTDKPKPPTLKTPKPKQIQLLEKDLADWFESKKRARGVRVTVHPRPDGTWFIVRHGELYNRQGVLEGEDSETIRFRPEKHDVVVYDPRIGELRVHACSPKENQLYKSKFGLHIFGDENAFPGTDKYSLEPLKKYGPQSLACDDIEGLDSVTLKEIRFYWPGTHPITEILRGPDLFAAWESRKRGIPPSARPFRANLLLKFTESRTARTVVLHPSNIAHYTRNDDDASSIIENFLREREFIKPKNEESADEIESAEKDLAGV